MTSLKVMRCALAAALIGCSATQAGADLVTVSGVHTVEYDFRLGINVSTTTPDFDQVRFPVPTVHTESLAQNYWGQYDDTGISVRAQDGGVVEWATFPGLDPFNPGEVNSGFWIRVYNPTPGQPFAYTITLRINGFSLANQSEFRYDAERALSPNSLVYYSAPTPTVDSASPTVTRSRLTKDKLVHLYAHRSSSAQYAKRSTQPAIRRPLKRRCPTMIAPTNTAATAT